MALLQRRRVILAKTETTYGTDPTPAATDAVLVSALEVQPLQLELKDRELIIAEALLQAQGRFD